MIYQKQKDMKTTYTVYRTEMKGSQYDVMVVSGKYNYISISKVMPNFSRGSLGREFKTFDEATKAYKSPEMKSFILQVELGLVNPIN